jgi:hypothetical protein
MHGCIFIEMLILPRTSETSCGRCYTQKNDTKVKPIKKARPAKQGGLSAGLEACSDAV